MRNKVISSILVLAVIGFLIALTYTVANSKSPERFSEFYILGINGKAEDYPTEFMLDDNGKIIEVKYNSTQFDTIGGVGLVTLGIVNHEQQNENYSVKITINGQPASINFGGIITDTLPSIELHQGEKWENAIGIIPNDLGNNQEVVFFLFKNTDIQPIDSLRLFISVK